jgi:hypothetical protein
MLEVSRALNPECIHHRGDMRDVRLGRTFDAVFIHDAIMYITTEADLRKTFETAAAHLSEGGALLVVPDWVRETFHPRTHFGGHDAGERSMRFVEWTVDPDPGDTTYQVDYVYLFREATGAGDIRIERDRHIEGIFPRAAWIRLMDEAGFDARSIVEDDAEAFLGVRRAAESTG